MLAQASRLNFSTRLFNLIVTNIPGPQVPLYVLGCKLDDVFPVAFLPEDHALAIAIMSYDGALDFGLLGDYDALPDIDLIADGIADSLAELLEAARDVRPGKAATRGARGGEGLSGPKSGSSAKSGSFPPTPNPARAATEARRRSSRSPTAAPSGAPPPTCAPSASAAAARPASDPRAELAVAPLRRWAFAVSSAPAGAWESSASRAKEQACSCHSIGVF